MKRTEKLNTLHAMGFDESTLVGRGSIRARCSQCVCVVINGTPAHERGCPNLVHECKGCNALVPARVTYCADCL